MVRHWCQSNDVNDSERQLIDTIFIFLLKNVSLSWLFVGTISKMAVVYASGEPVTPVV